MLLLVISLFATVERKREATFAKGKVHGLPPLAKVENHLIQKQ